MDYTRAYQKALDDELVAPANCLKIGKSNLRLSSNLKSKEPTLQVHADQPKHVRVRSLQDYLCSATWWKKIQNPNMANIKLISESFSQKEDATTVKRQESTVCLSDVAETEAINEASHKKKFDRNASGSGADEGTGSKPGVPNVPTYGSDDEQISWKSSDEEDDDE
ncbi:hypothetical protein Tco_0007086 [Tanacetum coccineum]